MKLKRWGFEPHDDLLRGCYIVLALPINENLAVTDFGHSSTLQFVQFVSFIRYCSSLCTVNETEKLSRLLCKRLRRFGLALFDFVGYYLFVLPCKHHIFAFAYYEYRLPLLHVIDLLVRQRVCAHWYCYLPLHPSRVYQFGCLFIAQHLPSCERVYWFWICHKFVSIRVQKKEESRHTSALLHLTSYILKVTRRRGH